MPTIIEEGKLPEEVEYFTKCTNCSTKFKFKRKEAKLIVDQRDGSYLTINCPFCNSMQYTELSDKNIWQGEQ